MTFFLVSVVCLSTVGPVPARCLAAFLLLCGNPFLHDLCILWGFLDYGYFKHLPTCSIVELYGFLTQKIPSALKLDTP